MRSIPFESLVMSNIVDYRPSLAEPPGGENLLDRCWYFASGKSLTVIEEMEHFLVLIRALED